MSYVAPISAVLAMRWTASEERKADVLVDRLACLRDVHLRQGRVGGAAGGDQHAVDRCAPTTTVCPGSWGRPCVEGLEGAVVMRSPLQVPCSAPSVACAPARRARGVPGRPRDGGSPHDDGEPGAGGEHRGGELDDDRQPHRAQRLAHGAPGGPVAAEPPTLL